LADVTYCRRAPIRSRSHEPQFALGARRCARLLNSEPLTAELAVGYPVVIDNDFAIWRSFDNHYWPAVYLVDRDGRI
jgi:hypothetical protein